MEDRAMQQCFHSGAMKWVRNPWWDGLWLLSGLPIGVVLIAAWLFAPSVAILLFAIAIVLEQAHVVSPMILVWTHKGLRCLAVERWTSFVALPAAVMIGVFLIPLPVVFGIYWTWNIYHYGMQNFGVLALYKRDMRRTTDNRARDGLLCLGITTFIMAILPFLLPHKWTDLLVTGALSFNHWLVDIGLSSRVTKYRWLFIGAVVLLGTLGFVWKRPFADHIGTLPIRAVPAIFAARWGVGIIHFLYSRWVWRFNDPRVLEAIGRDLFP
jgi:hypothetical protein